MNEHPTYETPVIVYEGDLEIQAGSPLSVVSDFEDLDW
jgi:hypothetical protein